MPARWLAGATGFAGIEVKCHEALEKMHEERSGDGVVLEGMARHRDLAEGLRTDLEVAGVTRAELFTTDKTRKAITFHDLRATHNGRRFCRERDERLTIAAKRRSVDSLPSRTALDRLHAKGRAGASRGAIDLVPPLLLVAGGVALAAFGIHQSMVLYVLFAALGVAIGVTHLRFWLTPPAHEREWFLAHMNGMGTSCITTVTAFVVVNARRFGMRPFDLALWAGPISVLAVGLTIWRRYYARRFTGNGAPDGAPKVQ